MSLATIMTKPTPIDATRASSPHRFTPEPTESTIVCGTDFSQHSTMAVDVAAALAKRLHERLVLVHALDSEAREPLPADVRDSLCLYERAQLHDELERLGAEGITPIEAFDVGRPDTIILGAAAAHHARLVVISSKGRRPQRRWALGRIAEKTAEAAPIPTLVVRAAAPFTAWAQGKRKLRIFVGADFSAPSDAALRWVGSLQQIGACEVVVAYLEPTVALESALDGCPSHLIEEMMARTEKIQARSFGQRVRSLLSPHRPRIRLEPGWGRSDAHLIQMATEERADLIVVGTHQRHGLSRLGHFSVSRGVLHYAPMSVACVPVTAG